MESKNRKNRKKSDARLSGASLPLDFFVWKRKQRRSRSFSPRKRSHSERLSLALGFASRAPRRQRDALDAPAQRASEKEASVGSRRGVSGGRTANLPRLLRGFSAILFAPQRAASLSLNLKTPKPALSFPSTYRRRLPRRWPRGTGARRRRTRSSSLRENSRRFFGEERRRRREGSSSKCDEASESVERARAAFLCALGVRARAFLGRGARRGKERSRTRGRPARSRDGGFGRGKVKSERKAVFSPAALRGGAT